MSDDIGRLSNWFHDNELVLNLKQGKTEAMVFGTAKRLATVNDTLSVNYKFNTINFTTSYKYLGIELNPTLNINNH